MSRKASVSHAGPRRQLARSRPSGPTIAKPTELAEEDGTRICHASQTDRYRGVAFLVFRYFAMRRELGKLQKWARTGQYRKGGWFEHPLSQVGFAILSAFILWPFFGLNLGGLALAAILTSVVALHELGHMAAFRLMGHRKARMIFIPLLGGIAIGGRPYDSRFEVAFVALMGAGFLRFPGAGADRRQRLCQRARGIISPRRCWPRLPAAPRSSTSPIWCRCGNSTAVRCCARSAPVRAGAGVGIVFPALGLAGARLARRLFGRFLLAAGAVFSVLSLLTMGSAVKPRHELKPIRTVDRFAIAAALMAVFAIHGYGVLWASALLA